jgi:hypothetical protein
MMQYKRNESDKGAEVLDGDVTVDNITITIALKV